jgi:hypothetical protein
MGRQPILLAVAPDGQRWEDPAEGLLFMLLEDLGGAGRGSLRVERLNPARTEALEIFRSGRLFRVRRQEGGQVATARSGNLRQVHAACARWAFRLDSLTVVRAQRMWDGFDGTLAWQIAPGEASADGAG